MNAIGDASRKVPLPAAILRMMAGFWVSAALYAAARLGLADELRDGPRTAEEMAQHLRLNPGALYRLLRALGSVGIFTEDDSGRFSLTELGECLRSGVPGSMRSYVITAKEMGWESWSSLLHSITTGETAFRHVHGTGYFDYLKDNPELAALFNDAMTGFVTANGLAVAEAYDFGPMSNMIDVGGGHGALTSAVLRKYPNVRGIVFDLPAVVAGAKKKLEDAGLSDRCTCIGGDFFTDMPAGGDGYLLASIIHDWDDEKALAILRNCRRAMSGSAKLLLVEMVIPSGNGPFFGKLLDLMMLVNFGGRERTEVEYRGLLEAAGFRLSRIIPTRTPSSIIEAVIV